MSKLLIAQGSANSSMGSSSENIKILSQSVSQSHFTIQKPISASSEKTKQSLHLLTNEITQDFIHKSDHSTIVATTSYLVQQQQGSHLLSRS
jgi:hypothetical protein